MLVPLGDDVSVSKIGTSFAVLKADMLVGKTDVPPQMTFWQAARKAVVMNISDLAAKGATPLALLASLGIPTNLTKRDIEQIGKGLNSGAKEYSTHVVGGDTSETEDLIISIAAFGTAKHLVLRSGAQPGDILATTGPFGLTSCGLKILKENLVPPPKTRKRLLKAILTPHARLKEGLALANTSVATASIDSSDGLAWSLHEISQASNVGFMIDKLPIAPETSQFAKQHNLDPLELALYGGEEYELIITIKPKHWKKAQRAIVQAGGQLIKIGRAAKEETILFKQRNKLVRIEARGYEHFKHERGNYR